MKFYSLFINIISLYTVKSQIMSGPKIDLEIRRLDFLVDIITTNFKKNGWTTILCIGDFPNEFYIKMQSLSYTIAITNIDRDDEDIKNVTRYYASSILINLQDIKHYEDTLFNLINAPYWHPDANIVIYYHHEDHEYLPKIFFSLWYYKAINAIIVQYDDDQETLLISHYSPYITDDYKLDHLYGCWTTRRIGMLVTEFDKGFTCKKKCHNVSLQSELRASNLGTCIGFSKFAVHYNASIIQTTLPLFEDKTKNMHGFMFRAHATELKPFLLIDDYSNGSYTLRARDGFIWSSMAKLMNFSISLTSTFSDIKKPFDYELTKTKIFDFAARKIDLCLMPMYLFDMVVVEIDYSFPYSDSGVCIMTHKAGYERKLFNMNTFPAIHCFIAKFVICFLCIWITFSLYHWVQKRRITVDQIGKDLLNTVRNVLLVTPHNPPRHRFFRPFLTISMWGFFAFNFATLATITSFLAAAKRGKEFETFEEIIMTGYPIYGIVSPDLYVSEAEENFRLIISKIVHVLDPFECIEHISNDSRRFCLIDCNMGRYLVRNRLNEKGEQYLHIARDRMHSHYLISMLTKHSPLTERFNKYLVTFYEAGLIKKWEQYRYNDIKEEAATRPLGIDDYQSLFNAYFYCLGVSVITFLLECLIFNLKMIYKRYLF